MGVSIGNHMPNATHHIPIHRPACASSIVHRPLSICPRLCLCLCQPFQSVSPRCLHHHHGSIPKSSPSGLKGLSNHLSGSSGNMACLYPRADDTDKKTVWTLDTCGPRRAMLQSLERSLSLSLTEPCLAKLPPTGRQTRSDIRTHETQPKSTHPNEPIACLASLDPAPDGAQPHNAPAGSDKRV